MENIYHRAAQVRNLKMHYNCSLDQIHEGQSQANGPHFPLQHVPVLTHQLMHWIYQILVQIQCVHYNILLALQALGHAMLRVISVYNSYVKEPWLVALPWIAVHYWAGDLDEALHFIPGLLQNFPLCVLLVILVLKQAWGKLEHELIDRGSKIGNEDDLGALLQVLVLDDRYHLDTVDCSATFFGGGSIDTFIIGHLAIPYAVGDVFEADPLALEGWLLSENFALLVVECWWGIHWVLILNKWWSIEDSVIYNNKEFEYDDLI